MTTRESAVAEVVAEHRMNVVVEGPSIEQSRVRVKCDGETCDFYAEGTRYWDVVVEHDAHLTTAVLAALDSAPQPALGDDERAAETVRAISNTIDDTYPPNLDPEAAMFRRVMKVAEEVGEVTEALFGALGENPRKGRTHTFEDVAHELLDVALAALAALVHVDPDVDPIAMLHDHADVTYTRLMNAITPNERQAP